MIILTEDKITEIFERFKKQNPNPKSELKWINAYTLLVSVVLSAQATDKSVNGRALQSRRYAAKDARSR